MHAISAMARPVSIDHASANGRQINSSSESADHELQLFELMLSAAKPMALKPVVLLDIPDIIATRGNGGPLSVEQIASHIAAGDPSSTSNSHVELGYLQRILKFLASYAVFTEQADQANDAEIKKIKYGLTGLSKLLVREGNDQSYAPLVLLNTEMVYLEAYQHLNESAMESCYTFNKAHGMSPWDYAGKNPQTNLIFNDAMATHSRAVMVSAAKMYGDGFKNIKSLVDVGGGTGSSLSTIVKEHPHIHGINLDLPHVIATAPPIPGVKFLEGNMFDHIPFADAVMMKWIMHDWEDEECVKLLRRSYDATPTNGKVLIVEAVVEKTESMRRRVGLLFDITMMIYTTGGKERTEEEYKKLFKKAGFKKYTIIKLPFLQGLIELSKS